MRRTPAITAVALAALAVAAIAAISFVDQVRLSADRAPGQVDAATAAHTVEPRPTADVRARAVADAPAAARILIDGTRFHPDELTVSVGEPVVWLNKDPFPHNIESASGGFRSGNLAPDAMWLLRPAHRGTFEYVCTLHPGMKATLRVK